MGRWDEAESSFVAALEIQRHGSEGNELAVTLLDLAMLQGKRGRTEEADRRFRESIGIPEAKDRNHPDLAQVLDTYAEFLERTGRTTDAARARDRAERIRRMPLEPST